MPRWPARLTEPSPEQLGHPGSRPIDGAHAPDPSQPPTPAGSSGTPQAPRHRARARPRPIDVAWPVSAGVVVALVVGRLLRTPVHPGEGVLAADGYLAATGAGLPAGPLTPPGAGALHVAGYALLTRAFERHASLVSVGREALAVSIVLAAALAWWAGRRLGLGVAAGTAVALVFAVPLLLMVAAGWEHPAVLAVAWAGAAGCLLLASGRLTWIGRVLATVLAVPAVVLAPDTALLLLSGAAVLLAGRRWVHGWRRWLPASLVGAAFVAVAVLVRVPGTAGSAAAGPGLRAGLLAAGAASVLIGVAATRLLPALRPLAAAVAATALTGLVPPARLGAVVVCLPAAVLLAGALAERALEGRLTRGARRMGAAVAVLALAAVAVAAVAVPVGGRPPGDHPQRALLAWARAQLAPGTRLLADRLPAAELRHAGARPQEVVLRDAGGHALLRVTEGSSRVSGRPVSRFSGDGGTLTTADPAAGMPTPAELTRRHQLADAILANRTTQVSAPVQQALRAANVDPRLLGLLAALTAQSGVGIADLPPVPGEFADLPARRALFTSVGGMALRPGSPDTHDLLLWLRVQRQPYRPDTVTVTEQGVLVAYRYASAPDAMVTRSMG